MIELNEISKIGFGSYRISAKVKENVTALGDAIRNGCNLIDTASNYMNGDSEKLIGQVLKSIPERAVFLITKAGYISGANLKKFKSHLRAGGGQQDLVHVSRDLLYSIHPEYLEHQIEISLKRLNRKYIDCFLLHSPEYFFRDQSGERLPKDYYDRIAKAFMFLETYVKRGIIRYYGVSSNTLTLKPERQNATDLNKLLNIARLISSDNHFKFIQFPFNIIEDDAYRKKNVDNLNLLQFAKSSGIITIGNRPINSNTPDGPIKLIISAEVITAKEYDQDQAIFDEFKEVVRNRLISKYDDGDLSDISCMAYLDVNWSRIEREDVFSKVFAEMLFPFLEMIYDDDVPDYVRRLYGQLEKTVWKYFQFNSSRKVAEYLKENNYGPLVDEKGSLPNKLLKTYLEMGLDHVLIGMKKPFYVEELFPLFKTT